MRVLMVLFAIVALIWVFNKDINNEVEVVTYEPPLPQEYTIINQATKDLAIEEEGKTNTESLRSPIWDTIENNKEALKKEIIKALPLYANKPELFIVTNLLFRDEIIKFNEHAFLVTAQNSPESKYIIDKVKEKDKILFSSILPYLKPAGDKAKEICDTYSYSNCDPYINVLVDLGNVYNIQEKYEDAIPYLETASEHMNCFTDMKLMSPEQEVHTQLGLSYLGLKQFDAAVRELEASKPKAISFSTQMFGWKSELAMELQNVGYHEASEAYWKAEITFWEKEIINNIENEQLLKIKRKMKEKAEMFLSDLSK